MQIVILAAGRGTRMNDLTDNVPKPMLEIKGKPILAYKLEALPAEIDEVIFVIGYLGNKIQQYFGDLYAGKKISYVVQEQLNGTGGAVLLVKDLMKDDFLVMMGDDLYMREDVEKIMKANLAIVGMEILNSKRFGVIILDENGNLKETVENLSAQGTVLVNTGLYKLNKKFFDYSLVAIGKGEYGLPQTLALVAKDYPVKVEKANYWFPIGNPEDLEKAQEEIDKFI
ncbi:MAG: Bifunctional protein GlmU [Parcubacteria group bacterium GW2011_GWD2_38_11]|nr:MAG: Bifunctional protein GlmU [Parcubacteria group bacterium GW2011_GWD2_38_11]